ncbi:MAG: lysophospholipid acyltransferase family protein [Fimbriimonadales bacterium]
MKAWFDRIVFHCAYAFFKLFFAVVIRFPLFAWLRIEGRHNMPRRGPLILLANHLSLFDPVVVWYASPRHICFMGRADIPQIPIVGAVARIAKTVPIRQRSADLAGLKLAIETLQRGEVLGIFPEGELSESGKLQAFLPGVLLILRQTKAPIIPVGVINTQKVMPYGKLYPKPAFTVITVRFGRVIPAEEVLCIKTSEAQLEYLQRKVAELIEP